MSEDHFRSADSTTSGIGAVSNHSSEFAGEGLDLSARSWFSKASCANLAFACRIPINLAARVNRDRSTAYSREQ